jgi:2-aminoadipate transaminase
MVQTPLLPTPPAPPGGPAPLPPLAVAVGRVDSSTIRDLLAVASRPGVVSLAGGMPAPGAFPVDALREATDAVLARDGAAALQYARTEGEDGLRAWHADRHGVDPGMVTITSGSQQGLDLVARALVGPGDVVVSADPGYVGAVQAFRLAGADLVGIPSDEHGLRVDVLAGRLAAGLRPVAAYLVPDLSNPTGATLSEERRGALAALADRYGFWLVEDDPYAALRWSGTVPAPLRGRTDRLVSLGTMSKVLCPGLRVGHVVAPPELTAAIVLLKQAVDLHTSTLAQRVVLELVTRPGFLAGQLTGLPERYRVRAEAMTGALREHLGDRVTFAAPAGGMFVWARLAGRDTAALLPEAVAAGVAYVPGPAFAVTERHEDRLRLSFATPSPDEIVEGVRRLATVLVR